MKPRLAPTAALLDAVRRMFVAADAIRRKGKETLARIVRPIFTFW
jgi:hypothetical protein